MLTEFNKRISEGAQLWEIYGELSKKYKLSQSQVYKAIKAMRAKENNQPTQ